MRLEARVAITLLLKGIFYKSDNEEAWSLLISSSFGEISDYFEVIGLDVICDEAENFAYLQNRVYEEGEESVVKLIKSRELTYKVSLICVILRKKIVDFDMQSEGFKAIVSVSEIEDQLSLFLPLTTNEVKWHKDILSSIAKVEELGFIRALKNQEGVYEIKRAIKAFVDAAWLSDFNNRLNEYKEHGA